LDASSSDSRGIDASTSMSSESTSVVINIPKLAEVRKIKELCFRSIFHQN
jgi:hypothetical protein